jgi:hypothetical protein
VCTHQVKEVVQAGLLEDGKVGGVINVPTGEGRLCDAVPVLCDAVGRGGLLIEAFVDIACLDLNVIMEAFVSTPVHMLFLLLNAHRVPHLP